MQNIDAILDYIDSVKNAFLTSSDAIEISSRINIIQNKRNDTKLYLAVIGEFSSGKSTFINALLGFRLLKEAVMPTTACATYIECHASFLSINVSFFDGNRFSCSESSINDIQKYIYSKYSIRCNDLYQVITIITSDQTVARTVESLIIKVPGDAIPKNIVIIDTPGFNPGSSSVDNHQEITKDIVENVADAAIILTSQEQAMSATLSRFLNSYLKRCLHRCTYVVTKFDTLEGISARNEVLDYVRQRINMDLSISNPQLFGLSAVTMLPIKCIPHGKEGEWPILKKAFTDFMGLTWSQLQKSKDIVLSEHINTLVKDVARLCVEHLNKKQKDLKSDKSFLESHRVETIQTVCDKMVVTASNAIYDTISALQISFSSAESKSISLAEETIKTGPISVIKFKTVMIPKIKTDVENEAKVALTAISDTINNKVGDCVAAQISRMSQVFSSHYSQFPSLRPSESTPTVNLVQFKDPDLNFSIALSKIEALNSKEDKAAGGGAAGGAALGGLIGGPLGAIIGAGIGFFGGIIAGEQSESMRSSAIPLIKDEITSFFSSLKIKVNNEISSIESSYSALIKNFAQEHISKYELSVKRLITEHQNKIQELNHQIKSLKNIIFGLQNVQDDIEHELAILRIK